VYKYQVERGKEPPLLYFPSPTDYVIKDNFCLLSSLLWNIRKWSFLLVSNISHLWAATVLFLSHFRMIWKKLTSFS